MAPARVLRHVGNDVASAVDWIMENGDELEAWMSEAQEEPRASSAEIAQVRSDVVPMGTQVVTSDGHEASIARVHDDGTYDLDLEQSGSPRHGVARADFTVSESAPAGDVQVSNQSSNVSDRAIMPSSPPSSHSAPSAALPHMEMHFSGSLEEEDMDEDYPGESEPDTELGRLLSHLREFSELASMVSLQTTAQQGQPSGAGGGSNQSESPGGPVLAVGDYVVLLAGAARTSDGSRGPLRRGDVGEVIEVGEKHVRVRVVKSSSSPTAQGVASSQAGTVLLSGGDALAGVLGLGGTLSAVAISGLPGGESGAARPWWYLNSALAIAPPQDAEAAVAAAGSKTAVAASPETDCSVIRMPLKDAAATLSAVRRIVSRLGGDGDRAASQAAILTHCHKHRLLEDLAEGLMVCCRPGTQGELPTSSAAVLDSLLLAADTVATALFIDNPRGVAPSDKDALSVGDMVKFTVCFILL